MAVKKIILFIICICLIGSIFYTESLLPLMIMLFILDYYRKGSFIKRFLTSMQQRTRIKVRHIEWLFAILVSVWLFKVVKDSFVGVYTFHTSSMNGTLESGNVLLVNKFGIGARRNANSIEKYHRSPGFDKIKYDDIIVFNFPEGDTLLMKRPTESYYYLKRKFGEENIKKGGGTLSDLNFFEVTERPRFVKRVYGLPGDTIKIEGGIFYANHSILEYPEKSIDRYLVTEQQQKEIRKLGIVPYNESASDDGLVFELYQQDYEKIKNNGIFLTSDCLPKNYPDPEVFPFDKEMLWNMNNMGPLFIPAKGSEIVLNKRNVLLYGRIINVFEENDLEFKNGKYYINGKMADKYQFKMNYYWVMGDNFSHSFDSRFWGFVPENHVIGKVSKVL